MSMFGEMSTQLFADRIIKIKSSCTDALATDGTDFYYARTYNRKLLIWASNGDVMAEDDVDYSQQHIILHCKRIDDELYFIVVLGHWSRTMILYRDGKPIHKLELNERHVNHVREKGPVVKYSVSDQGLVQYSISGSKIVNRFIKIRDSDILHSSVRYISVNNTGKYLYIVSGDKILRHEHETGEQLVIGDLFKQSHGMMFSMNGEYIMSFYTHYSETPSRFIVSACDMTKTQSLIDGDAKIVYYTDHIILGAINDRMVAVVDGYVLFKYKNSFSRAMHNPNAAKSPFISNISGEFAWQLPVSYKYSDIDGGRLYVHDTEAGEIRTYRFKWDPKRVCLQAPDVQKTIITICLCLRKTVGEFMPRDIIYMIIDRVYQ